MSGLGGRAFQVDAVYNRLRLRGGVENVRVSRNSDQSLPKRGDVGKRQWETVTVRVLPLTDD